MQARASTPVRRPSKNARPIRASMALVVLDVPKGLPPEPKKGYALAFLEHMPR
jgi:hypothetical protein